MYQFMEIVFSFKKFACLLKSNIHTENGVRSSGLLFLNYLIYFNWRIITLQYCDGFCHI